MHVNVGPLACFMKIVNLGPFAGWGKCLPRTNRSQYFCNLIALTGTEPLSSPEMKIQSSKRNHFTSHKIGYQLAVFFSHSSPILSFLREIK